MKIVIQRTRKASVSIDGEKISEIAQGLMILVGVVEGDTDEDMEWIAQKAANMRIFDDEQGVMNRSVIDVGGEVLAVSQFTLAASTKKGNRPSYIHAARHELAIPSTTSFATDWESCLASPRRKACLAPTCRLS